MTLRGYLMDLREKQGYLTPRVVVDDARPPTSQLHDRFEWDDSVAGEKYRLDQARDLIRSVKITYVEPNGKVARTRAFISIESPERQEYFPAEEVRDDPMMSALALRTAEREWRSLFTRYRHLEEFLALVQQDLDAA